jgi:deoxyribonuclease-4
MTSAQSIRVRQLLSTLNPVERADLKKLLPAKIAANPPAEPEGTRYPAALLSALPKEESYSLLGFITEDLLHYAPANITMETLATVIQGRWEEADAAAIAKVAKSKTTEPYLQHICETRKKIRFAARGEFTYEAEVGTGGPVVGHPDIRTPSQVFEVKMTGQLKQNWLDFLLQVFAYAALAPEITDIYLVLPLQEIVWHHAVDPVGWPKRDAYRAFLYSLATKKSATRAEALALIEEHHIGSHMSKGKNLANTIRDFPAGKPHQIFLSGPQSARMNIAEADLAAAASVIQETGTKVYIHSQYIINLCTPAGTNDDYHTALLIKNLQYGVAMGARGVVVHVGKSTTHADPMENMRTNIKRAMEHATADCPILLETPAGQGTEVLTTFTEFVAFVATINDPRVRVCIDTCHVFAAGEDPVTYLKEITRMSPTYTKLIHFNDSATPCGSCLDRHAFVGEGHIGMEKMRAIAVASTAASLPMVIE